MAFVDDDEEDLLGGLRKKKKKKPKAKKEDEIDINEEDTSGIDLLQTFRGVTITWLMQAFRKDRYSVKKMLADCPPLRQNGNGQPVYDFVQAAAFLVKPRINIHEYIKKMKPEELPTDLQKEYWDARLKRQKYMVQAKQLYHAEDIAEVFGEAFKHIKTSTQLWSATLERTQGLTPDQYKTLEVLADQLLADLHKVLVDMQKRKRTASSLGDEDLDAV